MLANISKGAPDEDILQKLTFEIQQITNTQLFADPPVFETDGETPSEETYSETSLEEGGGETPLTEEEYGGTVVNDSTSGSVPPTPFATPVAVSTSVDSGCCLSEGFRFAAASSLLLRCRS